MAQLYSSLTLILLGAQPESLSSIPLPSIFDLKSISLTCTSLRNDLPSQEWDRLHPAHSCLLVSMKISTKSWCFAARTHAFQILWHASESRSNLETWPSYMYIYLFSLYYFSGHFFSFTIFFLKLKFFFCFFFVVAFVVTVVVVAGRVWRWWIDQDQDSASTSSITAIVNHQQKCVSLISLKTGELLRSINSSHMQAPSNVASSPDGHLFVSDDQFKVVLKFDVQGTLMQIVKPAGEVEWAFSALAICSTTQEIIFADKRRNQVMKMQVRYDRRCFIIIKIILNVQN